MRILVNPSILVSSCWILIVPSVVCFTTTKLQNEIFNDCCPVDTYYDYNNSSCSNGNEINLNCSFVYIDLPILYSDDHQSKDNNDNNIKSVEELQKFLDVDKYCLVRGSNNVSTVFVCDSEIGIFFKNSTTSHNSMWKFYFFNSLMTISGVFCILTILAYASFSELWNVQDKLLMYTIFSLFVVIMTFNVVHLNPYLADYYHFCIILAFLLYYFTLTTYFWLNVIGFNIWRQVWFKKCSLKEHTLFLIYNAIGWGGPMCFLLVALITNNTEGNHLKPSFGVESCWFIDVKEIWTYCTGPIAVLLTINITYIVLSTWKLCRNENQFDQLRLKTLRYRRTMFLKLVLVLGSDWIFEIFHSIWPSDYFLIPVEIIDALQGLLVFLILVVHRVKVKKILVIKKPCGINFPKSWTELPDEEYDTVLSNAMQSVIMGNHWTFFVY